MSELADFLHKLIDAIDRPADHPAAELHQEVDAALAADEAPAPADAAVADSAGPELGEAPEPSPEAGPAPEPPTDVSADVEPDLAAQPEEPPAGG